MINWRIAVVLGKEPDVVLGNQEHVFQHVKGGAGGCLAGKVEYAELSLVNFGQDLVDDSFLFHTRFLIEIPFKELEDILFGGFLIVETLFVFFDELDNLFLIIPNVGFTASCFSLQGLFFKVGPPFGLVIGNAWALVDLLGPEKQGAKHRLFNKDVSAFRTPFGRHAFKIEQSVLTFHLILGKDVFVFGLLAFKAIHGNLVAGKRRPEGLF